MCRFSVDSWWEWIPRSMIMWQWCIHFCENQPNFLPKWLNYCMFSLVSNCSYVPNLYRHLVLVFWIWGMAINVQFSGFFWFFINSHLPNDKGYWPSFHMCIFWRDGSVVKSCCSSRGPSSCTPSPHGGPQPSIIPVPGNPGSLLTSTNTIHMDYTTHTTHTHIYIWKPDTCTHKIMANSFLHILILEVSTAVIMPIKQWGSGECFLMIF